MTENEYPLSFNENTKPITPVLWVRGGNVTSVTDLDNNEVDYFKVDYDSLENMSCPICNTDMSNDDSPTARTICPKCKINWKDGGTHTLQEVFDALRKIDLPESVDVVASGYEWVCPFCDLLNKDIEHKTEVTCQSCLVTYEAEPPNHAYE